MSKESKKLRDRAAKLLRQSRRSKPGILKTMRTERAASLKALAANEEWLEGEPQRSRKRAPKKSKVPSGSD